MTTTTSDPAPEVVGSFCELSGVGREEAIRRLRANNNDINAAVDEWLTDPTDSKAKYRWDESAFSAGREGDVNNSGISFNIQGPDDLAQTSYYDYNSTAPTRPPSRNNNRSPLGRLVDLTALEAAGAPTNSAQEDEDLQRALRESAAESGMTPQEVGIVDNDTSAKYFGPAKQSDYEDSQWSLVPTKANAAVSRADPAPSSRKREEGAPAFLRSSKDHRLGALVSIYDRIPLARNTLLSCGSPTGRYGHNSQWWKGQVILREDVLAAMHSGETPWGEDAHPEFAEELHRLIAFLDNTERRYGSVDSLAETSTLDPSYGAWQPDIEARLFEVLKDQGEENPSYDARPFMTRAKVQALVAEQSEDGSTDDNEIWSDDDHTEQFGLLDINLEPAQYAWINSLYDAIDLLFWRFAWCDSSSPKGSRSALLIEPADIFTVRFGTDGGGLQKPCDVPAVLYLDRYLEDRKELCLKFQTRINQIRRLGLQGLQRWEKARLTCQGEPGCSNYEWLGNTHDKRDCYRKTIETSKYLIERQTRDAQWRYLEDCGRQEMPYTMHDLYLAHTWSGPFTLSDKEQQTEDRLKRIIKLCQQKLEEIEQDLKYIQEKKQQCFQALDGVSKPLTCREEEASADFEEKYIHRSNPNQYHAEYWNPTHKYLLRGVATTHEISYICTKSEGDRMDMDQPTSSQDQWWKISYTEDTAQPAKCEKTDLDTVLLAAGTESKNPILVYATEKALTTTPTPLSDALRRFVNADNREFQRELAQEQQPPTYEQPTEPEPAPLTAGAIESIPVASPVKRKQSTGSSIATLGSSDLDSRDLDMTFSDEPESFASDDDNKPRTTHQEFASPAPLAKRLDGVVESLTNCSTKDDGFPTTDTPDPATQPSSYVVSSSEDQREEELQDFVQTVPDSKPPEMEERSGGPMPFITRPNPGVFVRKRSSDGFELESEHLQSSSEAIRVNEEPV